MIIVWIILGVAGSAIALFVWASRAAPTPPSPASSSLVVEVGEPVQVTEPEEEKSPFEYDEDNPFDWWDNQYGPHGFQD